MLSAHYPSTEWNAAARRNHTFTERMTMKTKFVLYLLFLPLFASAQTYTYSTLTKFPPLSKDSAVITKYHHSAGNIYGLSFYGGKYNQGTL